MPFPFCRHDSLGKGGAFLSGMLLMAMAVARLTFSLSEGSKGAVVVYVKQLRYICRELLGEESSCCNDLFVSVSTSFTIKAEKYNQQVV